MKTIDIRACRRGFTLLELLNVVIVIAILALILVPRLMGVVRKAKESRLRADLQQLRKAITLFQSDTGMYPLVLRDVVAPSRDMLDSSTPDVARELYQGPYITPQESIQVPGYPGLPLNPFVDAADTDVSHHWTYNSVDGSVKSAVLGTTLDGVPYEQL